MSFEEFVQAIESLKHLSTNLVDAVSDFRDYLDEETLLPSWQHRLDVVNCAGSPKDVIDGNVYMCPAKAGSYSHQRCRYFGMYHNKGVQRIAEIEAVVDLFSEAEREVKWKNIDGSEAGPLKEKAWQKHRKFRPDELPLRVFLLGELYETNFDKDTRGGMFGPKIYYDVGSLKPKDAADLAVKLNGKLWSKFPG